METLVGRGEAHEQRIEIKMVDKRKRILFPFFEKRRLGSGVLSIEPFRTGGDDAVRPVSDGGRISGTMFMGSLGDGKWMLFPRSLDAV